MKPIEVIIPVPSERVQFSKELYDANPTGWKVEDKQGRPVRVLATDINSNKPIVGIDHENEAIQFSANGIFRSNGVESNLDLFMRPVESSVKNHDYYANVYLDGVGASYKDIDEANTRLRPSRIALLHIKFVSE